MFNKARLKLTTWYLLIIMTISISFSVFIYKIDVGEVERLDRIQRARVELRFGRPPVNWDTTIVEETEQRIVTNLILMNIAILAVSGISGYVLAGITLNPIKEMVEEQNRFISDASHEINTPLTSLKTAMEVYLRGKKQTISESKVLVEESIIEVNKLQSLANSLLQLARFEVPNNQQKFERLNIKDVLNEAIKKVRPLADKKKIELKSKITNITISGSRYGLVDLFVILLDNAIKYSSEKSVVDITTRFVKDSLLVSVKDKGMGISKKDLPHIFDRFYRSDQSRTRKSEGGYGLGLSIAKKIVDSHHGTIEVKSKVGQGSEFITYLPKR